jgi:formamidopyrimidine-DNA glycosylase
MPEMPEVETIARKLRRTIIGKRVSAVLLSGLPLRRPIPASFAATLPGRTIRRIHRRGKYLIAEMEPRAYWLIHLGMSGRIFYFPGKVEKAGHTHATIRFTDATELQYRDHRRFGLLAVYEARGLREIPELQALGCDPLDSSFNGEWLWQRLRRSRQQIKSFLLDQRQIAGLGNIYVLEALFHARLRPTRRCHKVSKNDAAGLARAIKWVLRQAIRNRGTSFSDFMDSDGELGNYQNRLSVFQSEGEKCRRCGRTIQRIIQGSRSSFFCPGCQK